MWARNLMVVLALVAAGLAVAATVHIAHPVVPERPATATERQYLSLRSEYGFTTDLATVRSIDAAHPRSSFGFPMSPAERALLDARQQLGQFVGTVDAVVSKDPAYAGIWLEDKGAGTIVIGWTSTLSPAEVERVSAVVPSWVPIRFEHDKYTYARLTAVQREIGSAMTLGGAVVETGVDVIHNRVEVTVLTASEATALASKYPRGLVDASVGTLSITSGSGTMPAPPVIRPVPSGLRGSPGRRAS